MTIIGIIIVIAVIFFDLVQMVASIIQVFAATGMLRLALLAFSSLGGRRRAHVNWPILDGLNTCA